MNTLKEIIFISRNYEHYKGNNFLFHVIMNTLKEIIFISPNYEHSKGNHFYFT